MAQTVVYIVFYLVMFLLSLRTAGDIVAGARYRAANRPEATLTGRVKVCGPNGCRIVNTVEPTYEWRKLDDCPQWALYYGGVQVGSYSLESDCFRPYDAKTAVWDNPCDPPAPLPEEVTKLRGKKKETPKEASRSIEQITKNFGIGGTGEDGVQWKPSRDCKYSCDGKEISKLYATRALTDGVPEDERKLRLSIFGPDAERRSVLTDLDGNDKLRGMLDRFVVQNYAPSDVLASDAGFVTSGHPTIYVQKPDGTVLHRQDDYRGGADRLALAMTGALRKADPNYRPAEDPDLSKPPEKTTSVAGIPLWALLLAGVGGVLFLIPKKA